MWTEVNGEKRKIACGPCIRGHRSSKCDHRDRVLVEVRKPGRPLSSCPHPSGSCSCERVVIKYAIPKASECACPSKRAQQVNGTSNRVHKTRSRKSISLHTPASLEKALKASEHADTDTTSLAASTATRAPSEGSASNGPSPPSSASSTPFILPSPAPGQSQGFDVQLPEAHPAVTNPSTLRDASSCCGPKPVVEAASQTQQPPQRQVLSCCGGKEVKPVQPVKVQKSCCSGNSHSPQFNMFEQMTVQPNIHQNYVPVSHIQQTSHFQGQQYPEMHPAMSYGMQGNVPMGLPAGFYTPIYNHIAPGYQQSPPLPANQIHRMPTVSTNTAPAHNCHCGDSCSCFGCAAHPNNATMTEYLRWMNTGMSTGKFEYGHHPTYDLPTLSYPHQPGFGAEATSNLSLGVSQDNFQPFAAGHGHMAPPTNMMAPMGPVHTPANSMKPWEQRPAQASLQHPSVLEPYYFDTNETAQEVMPPLKTEQPVASPVINEGEDETAPTLSPSTFFWQEMELPAGSCNDATGTCQCGDGCACVGCLTHGGHNGVPLSASSTAEQVDFNGFLNGTDFGAPGTDTMRGAFAEGLT